MNAPTILGFETAANTALVKLNHAPPAGKVRVNVYANTYCDASGAGEGEVPIGVGLFNLDGTTSTVRVPLKSRDWLPNYTYSATATVAGQGTSEFSSCQGEDGVLDPIIDGAVVDPTNTDPTSDPDDNGGGDNGGGDDGGGDNPNPNADPDADGVVPTAGDDLVMVLQSQDTVWPVPGVLENDSGGPGLRAVRLSGGATMPADAWTLRHTGALVVDGRKVTPGTYVAHYRSVDPDGVSNEATLTFVVLANDDVSAPVDDAPVARPDRIVVAPGQTKVVPAPGLLANDYDPDHTAISAVSPVAGTFPLRRITLAANGALTVRAAGLAEGNYTFTYRAKDATGLLSPPTLVTVAVDNANSCPTPASDAYTMVAGTTLDLDREVGPLRNDTDPDLNLGKIDVVGATAQSGETSTVAFSRAGLTLYRNGRLVMNASPGNVTSPPPGASSFREIRYTLADTAGETCLDRVGTLRITFTGNQAPVAAPNFYATSAEAPNGNAYQVRVGGTLRIPARGLLGNDSDPDGPKAALTAELVSKLFGGGSVTVDAAGGFTLTAPTRGIRVGDSLRFTYVAIDELGARSDAGPATATTVTVLVTASPPPLLAPIAVNDAAAGGAHVVHADGLLKLTGGKGLLANDRDPDRQPIFVEPTTQATKDPRISIDRDGGVRFTPTLGDSGRTFTYVYRAIDFDGLRSNPASLTIRVAPPRERCATSEVIVSADIDGAAASATGRYRHCYNLVNVNRYGFAGPGDTWRPGSPVTPPTSGTGTPGDLDIGNGDLATSSTLARWFLDDLTGVVSVNPGDPQTAPTVSGSPTQGTYGFTANWNSCLDILGPVVTLIKASKVQAIINGLRRIPFLGGAVDEVIEGSAAYLSANAQTAVKILTLLVSALDFLGGDNAVKDWFEDFVQSTNVEVRHTDGSVESVPLYSALILVIGGAEIIRDATCPNWAGWTPANATVTVTANQAGTFKVAPGAFVNGYLDNLELYSPADSVEWSTDVVTSNAQIVGADLYTGS